LTVVDSARFWIGIASRDHVERGVVGGFCMFSHGRHEAVKRVAADDWIAYYSPRSEMQGGEAVRAFTAIGRIRQGEPYQALMAPGRNGWRRDVDYCGARPAGIVPLITELSFIKDPAHWGMAFRRGLFQVPRTDFMKIARAMGLDPDRL
jgi:hypothetical protein